MYLTNIRYVSEIRGNLLLKTLSLKGKRFISGKLLMTMDKGSIFVEYTVVGTK